MDASFNPPTLAHQALLVETAAKYKLDCYLALLSTSNADKGQSSLKDGSEFNDAPIKDLQALGPKGAMQGRLMMMKAMASCVASEADDVALARELAVAYTDNALFVDKARALQAFVPGTPVECYFILGMDTLVRVLNPKYYQNWDHMTSELASFFEHSHFVYAARKGAPSLDEIMHSELKEEDGQHIAGLLQRFDGHLHPLTIQAYLQTISSTMVRTALAGTSKDDEAALNSMVCAPVLDVIRKHALYTSP